MWSFLLGCSATNHFVSFIMLQSTPPLGPLFPGAAGGSAGVLRNICRFEGAIWQGLENLSDEEIS